MRFTTIASASPPLVRPRGLIFEVELNFQLGPISGLGHLFPCGDRGNPEPVPHSALQALSAELHLFFLGGPPLVRPAVRQNLSMYSLIGSPSFCFMKARVTEDTSKSQ